MLYNWKLSGDTMIGFYHNTLVFDSSGPHDFSGNHLGGVKITNPASLQPWEWQASSSGISDGLGTFETFQQTVDVPFTVIGDNIFAVCRGEFYRNDGQLNQILHFRADGSFAGQFGLPQMKGTIPLAPGAGNNLLALGAVKVNNTIYIYTTEENSRGLHRWRVLTD
jgi:hypothetical protein